MSTPSPAAGTRFPPAVMTAMALVCTMLWAGAQIGVKLGLSSAPPLALMGVRFTLASLILLPVALWVKSPFPARAGGWWRLVVLGLLNNTVYLGLTALGLDNISAGLACVLTGINPLALALGGWLFLREAILVNEILSLLGALGGIVYVMAGRLGHDNTLGGMATVLGANFVMVAGNLCYKRWQHESGLLVSHMVQLFVGGVTLLALSWGLESAPIQFGPAFWAAELFLIFGVSFGAMLIWLFMLSQGSAAKAGAFLFLVPIFGLLQGALFLGEHLSLSDGLGAAVTTGFVYLAQRGRSRAAAKAAPQPDGAELA